MLELPPSEDEAVEYKYSLPVGRIKSTVEAVWAGVEGLPAFASEQINGGGGHVGGGGGGGARHGVKGTKTGQKVTITQNLALFFKRIFEL